MTILIFLAISIAGLAVWERADAIHQALDDVIFLLEEIAQPERDGQVDRRRR